MFSRGGISHRSRSEGKVWYSISLLLCSAPSKGMGSTRRPGIPWESLPSFLGSSP